jgi:hypothetical protein
MTITIILLIICFDLLFDLLLVTIYFEIKERKRQAKIIEDLNKISDYNKELIEIMKKINK